MTNKDLYNDRMPPHYTFKEVAYKVGKNIRTITRWEKAGRLPIPKRDYKNWRFYTEEDLERIKVFFGKLE